MKLFSIAALTTAVLLGSSVSALALERGGVMTYGRYTDSLFLDPVLNDANVDIWILTNIYDTLISPSKDGFGLDPNLATEWALINAALFSARKW